VFAPVNDVELGKMSAQSLADDPEEYPILPESEYPDVYAHLRRIVGGVIVLKELMGLSYSRDQEAQADERSVRYLSTSEYACDGTAGFFIKLQEAGDDVGIPAILSDHPASAARVSAIQREAKRLGCSTKPADPSRWKTFQQSLRQDEPAPDARE